MSCTNRAAGLHRGPLLSSGTVRKCRRQDEHGAPFVGPCHRRRCGVAPVSGGAGVFLEHRANGIQGRGAAGEQLTRRQDNEVDGLSWHCLKSPALGLE